MEFELIAKTFMGLEPVLAQELTQMGANNVQIGRRMVSFTGDKEMMYRANFQLHTAIRILKPIKHFKARSAEDVYEQVKTMKMDDLKAFHQREIANRKYRLLLLGDEADWDMDILQKHGTIQRVSLEDIFGY